ncbi:MAG: ATP-binding cassette domain-containing protein [Candidatus Marinimicrobia bacterium]|nr:ATP-binding cassette domain-containing protein [Candidatus Neomarinimicrobiota bacterium]
MIDIKNVSKSYKLSRKQRKEMGSDFVGNSVLAVDNISFLCKPGRIFGLIGPNGAGKTTMLRMIGTMLAPTSGIISVNGFDTVTHPQSVKQSLGFLSGNTGLYDRLTAEEMVKYYADLHEMSEIDYQKSRDRLFALLDMEEFAGRRIGKLSTGMMQKVNIARTMIHEPEVVVFDEPTSGLDVMASRSIIQLIKECGDEGRTVIFSSHRLAEIQSLCDDLAIIHKGELYFNGTYEEFESQKQEATLEDEFIRMVGEGEHV